MMSSLSIIETSIASVKLIQRSRFEDARGRFSRVFCSEELEELFCGYGVAQINFSETKSIGTLRGMHFQPSPHSEIKLVTCVKGAIFDVVVDIRPQSNTYLSWFGNVLSEDNRLAMLVPEGFAHGFQSLSDNAEVIYCHSKKFNPMVEAGLNPLDPKIGIAWPLPVTVISERDSGHLFL